MPRGRPTSAAASNTARKASRTENERVVSPAARDSTQAPADLATQSINAQFSNLNVGQQPTYLNPLPAIPQVTRPAPLLFIWGASDSGQLGLGKLFFKGVPKPRRHQWVEQQINAGAFGTEPGAGLVSVASGGMHTYILDERGTVWSCGSNDEGALGREVRKNPTEDTLGEAQDFAPLQSLVDERFRVVQVTTGDNFGAALNEKGDLKAWGTFRQDDGKSKFSSDVTKQFLPTTVSVGKAGEKISYIAGGENHLLVLTTHGSIYTWGIGESGQLGRRVLPRHRFEALVPQKVVLGRARSRKAVTIGSAMRACFAVDELGDVWGWGSNSRGQLGNRETGEVVLQPVIISGLSPKDLPGGESDRVIQICGGEWHTLFLTSSGKVFACGASDDFQLGLPDDHEAFGGVGCKDAVSVSTPVLVPFPASEPEDPVVSIAAGSRYSMVVTRAGMLYSWGVGASGELGLNADTDVAETPQVVVRKEGSWAAKQVSCGGQHAMGLFSKRES